VGMAKNVGKTVCLRSILDYYKNQGEAIAVTSIGVDGEKTDVLYENSKPELTFYPGMLVQTSEFHYRQRKSTTEIIDVSREKTAMGRLISARVVLEGKMILSGYSYSAGLQRFIKEAHTAGSTTVLIDGALSRMSLASPVVAQAMILCTGAALSKNLVQLVKQTQYQYELINLPLYPLKNAVDFSSMQPGIWGISPEGEVHNFHIRSALQGKEAKEEIEKEVRKRKLTIYLSGLLNDSFLQLLLSFKEKPNIVVSDFTKIFVQPPLFYSFLKAGGRIFVVNRTQLLAVCANPISVDGYKMNSVQLCQTLSQALGREVYDIKKA
ncbi:MAG: hypothetical protein RSA02_02965, partial [Bacteroidales bacterium]